MAARRAHEPRRGVLVLRDEASVGSHLYVAAHLVAAVVAGRPIRIEPNQPRKPAGPAVHLVHDLFVVDAFEELAGESHPRGFAALAELVQKAVSYELKAFFYQLVVDLALLLDLLRRLEFRGETGLELAEADVVEAGGIDVVAGDAAAGFAGQLDRPIHGPVGVRRVVDGSEDLTVHRHLWR